MKLRVMYIDDEEELCENFVDCFSTEDVSIITFSQPPEAIEAAKISPPDLIFIDFRLPSISGDEVAQLMDPTIPKCLITGDIYVKTTYAFQKIFTKPYNQDDILNELEKWKQKKK